MTKIVRFAVTYPVTILMLMAGIILLGVISFGKLGTDLFPDLNNPRIYVELNAGERPPEEIEKLYIDQIESLSMRQKGVVDVTSVCETGSARITVEYQWDRDMDEAFLDLQKDLTSFSQNSDLQEFAITQYDPNSDPVMVVALSHDKFTNLDEIRRIASGYIRNELVRLEGIADVKLTGEEESEVVIETNHYLLESYGLTSDAVAAQIANYNRNVSGGSIVDLGLRYVVKGVSVISEVEDLNNIIVGFRQSTSASGASSISERTPVFLRDIGTVVVTNKEPENIVTLNGKRCIGLSIYKEPRFNTVKAVEALDKAIAELSSALPDYVFTKVDDQGSYISGAIKEVWNSALLGILLAVFVLYIFLRRIGSTVVVSIAIPISIIATFNLMYFNDLTINIMTLGGLALGAGMLVDNAIVVLENIFRNHESGLSLKESAIKGTAEVGGAITASTLTTIVVFLPIVYLQGATGEMFKDQAWTVAFSLLSSLFVAILVIPMLVTVLFKDKKGEVKKKSSVTMSWYSNWLAWFVDHRGLVIILSVVLLAGTVFLLPRIGTEFMPRSESAAFSLEVKLPEGTELKRTSATLEKTGEMIKELLKEKVDMIYIEAGSTESSLTSASSSGKNENIGTIKVILNKDQLKTSSEAIRLVESYVGNIQGIDVTFQKDESAVQTTLGTNESPFVVELRGDDFDEMGRILNEIKNKLEPLGTLYNLGTSLEEGTPEVEIVIDRLKTSSYNVNVNNIISQVTGYLSGSEAGSFEKGGEMKDISIKVGNMTLHQLGNIAISTGSGSVPLSELATIRTVVSPGTITRRNQNRTTYVRAMIVPGKPFDQIVKEAEEVLKEIPLPTDYKIEVTGEEKMRRESMSSLTFALILSIVLVYMVLASQFESLVHPFVILLTIPLAGIGSVWTFFLLGKTLNMMAYIGIIMLAGIAVNNSIILVDRINQLRSEGRRRRDAIIEAGLQRIRPILMTSLTTILALLPLTIGFGESASLRSPMALAVIGGLITSTLLTLVVIPCVYWVLDSLKELIMGQKDREAELN